MAPRRKSLTPIPFLCKISIPAAAAVVPTGRWVIWWNLRWFQRAKISCHFNFIFVFISRRFDAEKFEGKVLTLERVDMDIVEW